MAEPTLPELRKRLDQERARLLEAAALPIDALEQPTPAGWSVRQVLAHVASSEALNVKFARAFLTQERPVQLEVLRSDFPDFAGNLNLDDFNAYMATKLEGKPAAEVLADLARVRAETLAWMETVAPEQLDRKGVHAVWGEVTLRALLRVVALHDRMHRDDILRRRT